MNSIRAKTSPFRPGCTDRPKHRPPKATVRLTAGSTTTYINLGSYVNSWNTTSVSVNGANYTNLYVASGSLPAKINGYWYVAYNSSVAWGHFEAK